MLRGLRSRKGAFSAAAIAVIVAVPASIAIAHPGFPVTDVELHARDVWVTNESVLLAGRLNRQIEELDAAAKGLNADLDVLQDGDDVFLWSSVGGTIERIDPSYATLEELIEIPSGSTVAYGGDTLAIMSDAGELWTSSAAGELAFDAGAIDPVLELGVGAQVAVSPTGTVFASDPDANLLWTVPIEGERTSVELPDFGEHQLAAVGERPVVLDVAKNRLLKADGSEVALPEPAIRLQQSGPAHDAALLASGAGLIEVPLDGGEPVTIPAELDVELESADDVSAPVWHEGCAHGAWSGAQTYLYACDDGRTGTERINEATVGFRLEFRVNRDVIALNNLNNGDVWLVDGDMRLVDNWDDVTPPKEEDQEEGDEQSSIPVYEDALADRTEENNPPVAVDDRFGFRTGSAATFSVLDNDSDPDGDVLTIEDVDWPEGVGEFSYIDGRRAIQYTPDEGRQSGFTFGYTATDGRPNGTAKARVTVKFSGEGVNAAPEQQRVSAVSVEEGQKIQYNVLSNWRDPDGDDVFLNGVSVGTNDRVNFTPDGYITFEHRSGQIGQKEVTFTVSDGTDEATGTLNVTVEPQGSLDPVGTPDFVEVYVDEYVEIKPLENDLALNGRELSLLSIDEQPDAVEATLNQGRDSITFRSGQADTYYILYGLGAGRASGQGIIRVNVIEDPNEPLPPIAVKDTAYLRPGEPVTVPVLANDVSPSGRVLAVQTIDTEGLDSNVRVEVLGQQRLRISADNTLEQQVQFTYTVSDGNQTATTQVSVIPVPPLAKHQVPDAEDDSETVRAGDIVTVDVMDNDFHPDGVAFELVPDLVDFDDSGASGIAFVAGDRLRYQAPMEPGVYDVGYQIEDRFGETATAVAHFTVVADDPEANTAPKPLPLTSRVLAGESTEINIPLDGIDTDGDSVTLVGISSPPSIGSATFTSTTIKYDAFETSSGTDTFQYKVRDRYGLEATGTISIGVIQPPAENARPVAANDTIEVLPGRTASVDVLANDSDPNGFRIELQELLEVQKGITAEIEGPRVVVDAPETIGTYTIRYQMGNGRGGVDTAFLNVTVTEDAPVNPPTAEDIVIEPADVVGETSVAVDGLEHATNPGGRRDELVITVEGPNAGSASIGEDGRTITVTPGEWRQAIAYRVTNEEDGTSGQAFIIVPQAQSDEERYAPPYLDPSLTFQVDMNDEASWDIDDILIVPSGLEPMITYPYTVEATNSDGSAVYVDEDTVRFAPAEGYRGGATLSFEVTDGSSADDPTGRVGYISMPITVGDPEFRDTPPTFTDQDLEIEAGEDSLTIDLHDSIDHPNRSLIPSMTFQGFSGGGNGIDANLNGSELSVSAPRGTPVGSSVTVNFEVVFGEFTVPGSVQVTTVPSTKPLVVTKDDLLDDVLRGESASVAPLANDVNPFNSTGERLDIIETRIGVDETGGVQQVLNDDDTVDITAAGTGTGDVTIYYTVQDPTLEERRQVTGTITFRIEDVPDAPAAPQIEEEGDKFVTVSIDAPASNGADIDEYTISWTGGSGGSQVVTAPGRHVIEGLTNGTGYQFSVAAHNEHGYGDTSTASTSAVPFGAPTPPPSVSVRTSGTGTGDVTVNWGESAGNGRNVTGYEVRIIRGGEGVVATQNVGAEARSFTFDLNPDASIGENHTAEVIAKNAGNRESTPAASTGSPAVPLPSPASRPTASMTGDYGNETITFTWSPPAHRVDSYNLAGNLAGCSPATSTTGTTVTCANLGENQTRELRVQVVYNGVTSDWTQTTSQTTRTEPAPVVTGLSSSISGSGGNYTVRFTWNESSGSAVRYSVSGCTSGNNVSSRTVTCSAGYSQNRTLTVTATRVSNGRTGSASHTSNTTEAEPVQASIQTVRGSRNYGTSVANAQHVGANVVGITGTHTMCVHMGNSPTGPWTAFSSDSVPCQNETVSNGYIEAGEWMGCYSSGKWVRVQYAGYESIIDYGRTSPC